MFYFYLQYALFTCILSLRKIAYPKCIFRLFLFVFIFISIWFICIESIFQPRIEVNTNISENDRINLLGDFFYKNSPRFQKLDVQSQSYLLLMFVDIIAELEDFPHNLVRSHIYFHSHDYYINFLIKKAKFWNQHGTKFSPTQKENFVEYVKKDLDLLFRKSKYCENNIQKLIQYKDKSEIIFNEKPSTPPSSSSSLSSLKPYKAPGKGGPGAWLRNRLEYIEECKRERAYQERIRQENLKKNS
jgi:hypothetical protein